MNTIDEGKSRIFQPERVSFSSKDDITSLTNDGIIGFYDNFRIQLKVPILGVKHLELIRASVPCIYPTIPDTELVFWYYRLPKQVGYDEPVPPSAEYLHRVRIQPSFVPKELIYDGDQYPINRVYSGYDDLLVDLNKACVADMNNPYFIEGDISFQFNSELNKFEFVGNNIYPASDWNPTTDFVAGDIINYNGQKYVAKYGNSNVSPDDTTIAFNVHTSQDELIGSIYWSVTTSPSYFYSYAGYNDPNVETAKLIL